MIAHYILLAYRTEEKEVEIAQLLFTVAGEVNATNVNISAITYML